MLGIPYEGRIPAFAADNDVQPTSPSVLAQRQLREEQDNAFQQSLQVLHPSDARSSQEQP